MEKMKVRVHSITREADGINSYVLRPASDHPLPEFLPGAHIDVHMPNGLVRSYSLINPEAQKDQYIIAVGLSASSAGGSKYMHESLRVGDTLEIGAPRNNFALADSAPHHILIAGGIGITPIWSMVQSLNALEQSWELYYCARTRANAAFLAPLTGLEQVGRARLHLTFDHEPGVEQLDLRAVVRSAADDAHLYCCGPAPMLQAFEEATAEIEPHRVHLERFAAVAPQPDSAGFSVVLARSGRTIPIAPGRTILETLEEAGLDLSYACRQGICGTCETRVIEGEPDHRDTVLSDEERASNQTMMICCSGCRGDTLVLDL